jgi:hypothetical protein
MIPFRHTLGARDTGGTQGMARAMKARLLDDAARYDELAAEADRIGVGATDF